MAFDRWGMTEAAASELTGAELTEAALDAAETEIVDALGYEPDLRRWTRTDGTVLATGRAMGRAIAWQAAWRSAHPATAGDAHAGRLTGETLPDYSVTLDGPVVAAGVRLADRAVQLLRRWGWIQLSGRSTEGLRVDPPDTWREIGE